MAAAATRRRFGCETVRCDNASEILCLSRTRSKRVLVERRGRLNLQVVDVNEFVVSTFVCVRECRAGSGCGKPQRLHVKRVQSIVVNLRSHLRPVSMFTTCRVSSFGLVFPMSL